MSEYRRRKTLPESISEKTHEKDFDSQIKEALAYEAENLPELSGREEALRNRVMRQIEEEQSMKTRNWNVKRVLVTAAVMCVLGSAAAMAAGRFVGISSHSSRDEIFTDYGKIGEIAEKNQIPFEVKAPETFSNGYAFAEGIPVNEAGIDSEGNETQLPAAISLTYRKTGMADVTLHESSASSASGEMAGNMHLEDGTAYYYNQDHYMFVPPSYELSEEEQAAVDAGELVVSYGTEEVEESQISSVIWENEDVLYVLQSFNTSLTEEEMIDMAAEVIK